MNFISFDSSLFVSTSTRAATQTTKVPTQFQKALSPRWIQQPSDKNVTVGDNVTFVCKAEGVDGLTHIWNKGVNPIFLNGVPAANAPRRYSIEGRNNLVISGVTLGDDSFYSCTIFNFDSVQVKLSVQLPPGPPTISVKPSSHVFLEGSVVSLTCSSRGGKPAPTFRWLRNGQRVNGATYTPPPPGDEMGTSSSRITVTVTRNDHLANYSCLVFNAVNTKSPYMDSRIINVKYSTTSSSTITTTTTKPHTTTKTHTTRATRGPVTTTSTTPTSSSNTNASLLHATTNVPLYSVTCRFPSPDERCGYTQGPRWKIHQGPYTIHGFMIILSGGKGDDAFALFDPAPPISSFKPSLVELPVNMTYDMTSPLEPAGSYTLTFWYQLLNPSSRLDVFIRTQNGTENLMLSTSGRHAPWSQASVHIAQNKPFTIVFRGHVTYINGTRQHGVVAVDLVTLSGKAQGQTYTTAGTTRLPQTSVRPVYTSSPSALATTEEAGVPSLESAVWPSCSNSGWNITIDLTMLHRMYPHANRDNIFLGDTSCKGTQAGQYLTFRHGLHDCLTTDQKIGDNIIYSNDLFYAIYDPAKPFIIRQHGWTFTIECDVRRNVATSTHIHHDIDSHHVTMSAKYDVKLAFFRDPNFKEALTGNPLHVAVGDNVYVKVFTTIADWTVKMHVHTCYTKPRADSSDKTKYYIIKNGCEVDRNTHLMSQSTHETRFMFQDFEYSSNHEGLDIFCDATFCNSLDFSNECLQICDPSKGN